MNGPSKSPLGIHQHQAGLVSGVLEILEGETHSASFLVLDEAVKVILRVKNMELEAKKEDGVESVKVPAFPKPPPVPRDFTVRPPRGGDA